MNDRDLFGPAAACRTIAEIIELRRKLMGVEAERALAAYGMLIAARSASGGMCRNDALEVLDKLGSAKADLDKSACHRIVTALVTTQILTAAQSFADDMTIPCMEWPLSSEIVEIVHQEAAKHSFSGPWKCLVFGANGQAVGMEEFDAH